MKHLFLSLLSWVLWVPVIAWCMLGVYSSKSNFWINLQILLGGLFLLQMLGLALRLKIHGQKRKYAFILVYLPALGALLCWLLFFGAILLRMFLNSIGLQDWP